MALATLDETSQELVALGALEDAEALAESARKLRWIDGWRTIAAVLSPDKVWRVDGSAATADGQMAARRCSGKAWCSHEST
jgi:hypothetical protein